MTTTTPPRAALFSMRNGMVPKRTVPADVRRALLAEGLVAEHTEGYLELTPRGRGVDPATFEI